MITDQQLESVVLDKLNREPSVNAAEQNVRCHFGVSKQITLKPRVNASDITNNIESALRSWFYRPNTIDVTADGGKVRLNGKVNSLYERQVAESAAWAVPGATSVEFSVN